MCEVLHQCGQDWSYVAKVKILLTSLQKFGCKLINLWLCVCPEKKKKADLEAMFSDSYRQVDMLPRLRVPSCFPAEFPQCGLGTKHAVNHPGGQLTCSTGINWTWVICPGMRSQTISEFNYQCDLDSQLMQNQSLWCRLGQWAPGEGSVSRLRSAAGLVPSLRTGTPLRNLIEKSIYHVIVLINAH